MTTFFIDYSSIVLCLYGFVCGFYGLVAPIQLHFLGTLLTLKTAAFSALTFVGLALFCLIMVHIENELPGYCVALLFIGAVLYGMAYSMFWCSWTDYMDELCTAETRGPYSGLFFTIYYISQPLGNFSGSLLLSKDLRSISF